MADRTGRVDAAVDRSASGQARVARTTRRCAELPIGWHVKIVSVWPGLCSVIHIASGFTTNISVTV